VNPAGPSWSRCLRHGAAWAVSLAAVCVLLAGCGDDAQEPLVKQYPLDAGWSWDYRRMVDVELLDGSGTRAHLLDSARVECEGMVVLEGGTSFSVVSAILSDGPPVRGQDYFQQSPSDLQHRVGAPGGGDLDILPKPGASGGGTTSWAVPSGPGGGPAQEGRQRTVLAYPLLTGNSWVMQLDPRVVTRRVVTEEPVTVIAGRFPAVRIETTIHTDPPLQYTDWIAEIGLVRRELDWVVDEYLFQGNPAQEHVHAVIELHRYSRP